MVSIERTEPQFNENALKILEARYLLPGETPADMLQRASLGNPDYYEAMARFDLLPNSPTLFNAGTNKGTLSACFKFDIADALLLDKNDDSGAWPAPQSIMGIAAKAAAIQQYGGGVGYVFSALRPKGAPIKTTNGVSSGPVSFMDLYNTIANVLTQGGKRHGAQMAILHCDHADIADFIHCKDDALEILAYAEQAREAGNEKMAKRLESCTLSTFNISVAATDTWMARQTEAKLLFDTVGTASRGLLWEMAEGAWKTGDPGCFFIDTAERGNPTPWLFKLTGTNPCGEVPLGPDEPCNLLSINLSHYIRPITAMVMGKPTTDSEYAVDWERLEQTTRLAIRFLDDVLDANIFPHPDIDAAARYTRKLGLGGMGYADMLALMHIHYDTDEAVKLSDTMWESVRAWADDESLKLGVEKGPAPCFVDGRANGTYDGPMYRNATRLCWAPTGTISQLVGASSGCEPHFALSWTRYFNDASNGQRVPLQEKIPVLERCAPFVPKTAMEIDWRWHVRHQAAFQKHTDLAVSKTINMAQSATVQDVYDAYVYAWELGCKGVTIYRDGSRYTQVLNVTPPASESPLEPVDEEHGTFVVEIGEKVNYTKYPPFSPSPPLVGLPEEWMRNSIIGPGLVTPTFAPTRRRLPDTRKAVNHKFRVGDQEGYINVGLFEDGMPGELFVTVSKEGSTLRGLLDSMGILTSLCLQYGVPLEVLSRKMQGISFEPYGMTGDKVIPTATSIIDYIFHWMLHTFKPETAGHHTVPTSQPVIVETNDSGGYPRREHSTGVLCADCGAPAVPQEGCLYCSRGCGWSRC